MEKWMIIFAIACAVVSLGFGIACLCVGFSDSYNEDDEIKSQRVCVIILAAFHGVFAVLSTVFLCLHSAKMSFICGVGLSVVALIFFFAALKCSDTRYEARLGVSIMIVCDFACATGGYLNTYALLAWGISCFILFVVSIVNLLVTAFKYKYEFTYVYKSDAYPLSFNIINVVLSALIAAGCAVGLSLYFLPQKEIGVSVDTAIYRYDVEYDEVGKQIADGDYIYFNESCAFRLELEFSNLHVLAAGSQPLEIRVFFPVKGVTYLADGVKFEKYEYTTSKVKFWKYTGTLNTKSAKMLQSGYFVFSGSAEELNALTAKIDVEVCIGDEESTDGDAIVGKSSCNLRYKKHEYGFDAQTHVKKDLSGLEEGRYRVFYPTGCNSFKLTFRDASKAGEYCTVTVTNTEGDELYLLDIPALLEANLEEEVYAKLVSGHERVTVEITACESDNYYAKSIELEFTF